MTVQKVLSVVTLGVALVGCETADPAAPTSSAAAQSHSASPSTTANPVQKAAVPRCSKDIPFEPSYLPDGFGHEAFKGRFPGGRPLDDQRSTGGKRHEQQVVMHYRGAGARAIEIRRPGTIFTELAQADDAPTIEVLGTETSGFAPISPRGDDFIVQFSYPKAANSRGHDWCSLYSLNEYGVSLEKLKKVAEGLRPRD